MSPCGCGAEDWLHACLRLEAEVLCMVGHLDVGQNLAFVVFVFVLRVDCACTVDPVLDLATHRRSLTTAHNEHWGRGCEL